MYGIHISLKTLFLICLYFAICSTLYVSANLWLGTLVIAATIVWLIATTARAFNHHDHFAFGFSIFGWAWLVFWLGFYAETAKGTAAWDVPDWIFQIMSPAWDRNAPLPETVTAHSLQYSGPMGSPSPKPPS